MAGEDLEKYYKLLDVAPETPWEEIKRTYRDLIKVWHPDRFSNDPRLLKLAEKKTKEINFAFKKIEEDRLSIKYSYDNFGESPEAASKPPDKPAPERPGKKERTKSSKDDLKRQAEEWLNKARAVTSGNCRIMVDYLDHAIDLDPFLEQAYVERGQAYLELKEYSRAVEDFNEAVKLNHQSFESYRGRATAQFESGNYLLAVKDFSTAIEMEPSRYPALYFYRGKAYEKMGFTAEAAMDCRKNENLMKSPNDGVEEDPDAVVGISRRSQWITHAGFVLALCVIFILLYVAYNYLSERAEKKKKEISKTEKTASIVLFKEAPIEKKFTDDFMNRKYGDLIRSWEKERQKRTPSEKKEFVRDRVVRVVSPEEKNPETSTSSGKEKTLTKNSGPFRKDQDVSEKIPEDKKDTFEQWRKIKELEKSFPSFLDK